MKRTFTQQPNAPQGNATKKAGKLRLQYDKVKKGDIVAICKDGKDGFTESEVKSNTQIHQKSMSPLSPDGQFFLELTEPAMFSNIILSRFSKENEFTGQIENQVTLKTFMEVHGDYAELDHDGNHTTDAVGDSYIDAFKLIDESIAESIDADPIHKKRLCGLLKLGKQLKATLDAPLIEAMEPFIKRGIDEDKSSATFGEEDMSKSPVGAFQLWIGKPKTPSIEDFKIPGTDLVIWTRIFDDTQRIASKPIQSWDHLMRFIYEKGDSTTKGKRPFRFSGTGAVLAPSLYFNSEKKIGRTQYKLAELHIYAVDYAKSRNTMSVEDMALQNTLKHKALGRFVINAQPETNGDEEEQQQQQQLQLTYQQDQQGSDNYGYNGSPQQNAQQSDEMNDLDSLINEQEELSRDTKKPRTS